MQGRYFKKGHLSIISFPLLCFFMLSAMVSCQNKGEKIVDETKHKAIKEKAIILGFDGVDPDFLNRWMDEGHLPEIKEMIENPSFDYKRLISTNPPQSPVAWSTFATGLNPGGHAIYDFVRRDPSTYLPDVGTSIVYDPEFDRTGKVSKDPYGENYRKGTPFWTIVAREGIKTSALNIPFSFPPDEVPGGFFLSGVGTPDIRGTNSTFYYYGTDLTEEEIKKGTGGGKFYKLEKADKDTFIGEIEGPKATDGKRRVSIPFRIQRKGEHISIKLQDKEEIVKKMEFSNWFEIEFTVSKFYKVNSIVRFCPIDITPEIHLYMSPLSYHPESPYIPFTNPPEFSTEIFKKHGFFKTVGWVYDTSALNSEKVPEEIFLRDMEDIIQKKTEYILSHFEENTPNLFIAVWTFTDRISHMFYRLIDEDHPLYDKELAEKYGDAILQSYKTMDKIIGKIKKWIDDDTLLIILSDHGFHSFRRGLNLNTFLLKEGFLFLRGGKSFSEKEFLMDVDWDRTKAYALGTGQIYINLKGRERHGIVRYGKEYNEVVHDICKRLEELKDPSTGENPVSKAYPKREIFEGEWTGKAPDIQVAFKDGYRTSWETALGGIPESLFSDNMKKWSGDHSASDVVDTEAILITNRKVKDEKPWIGDIAPTILHYFNIKIPEEMDGKILF